MGVEIDARGDALTIVATMEGSPVERAGLKAGDRLLSVDVLDLSGHGLDKLVRINLLRK